MALYYASERRPRALPRPRRTGTGSASMDPSRVCDRYIRYVRYTAPRALHGRSMWDGHRGAQQRHSDPSRGAHGRSLDFLRHTQFTRDPDRCLMRSPCKKPTVGHLSIRLHGPSRPTAVTGSGDMVWRDELERFESNHDCEGRRYDACAQPDRVWGRVAPDKVWTSWLHTGAARGVSCEL